MFDNGSSSHPDNYESRRAAEERVRAERATDPAARRIHLELAELYTARVGAFRH